MTFLQLGGQLTDLRGVTSFMTREQFHPLVDVQRTEEPVVGRDAAQCLPLALRHRVPQPRVSGLDAIQSRHRIDGAGGLHGVRCSPLAGPIRDDGPRLLRKHRRLRYFRAETLPSRRLEARQQRPDEERLYLSDVLDHFIRRPPLRRRLLSTERRRKGVDGGPELAGGGRKVLEDCRQMRVHARIVTHANDENEQAARRPGAGWARLMR